MNDLLMNDTFENINFNENTQNAVTNAFSEVPLKNENNFFSNFKTNNNEISFDDSIFLSQINLLENEKPKENEISENEEMAKKRQIKEQCTKSIDVNNKLNKDDNKENIKFNNSTKKKTDDTKNKSLGQVMCYNENKKINYLVENSKVSLLSSWGLPEYVVEKYRSKNLISMFPWQVECLSCCGVLNGKNLVYSAPTSAGKTLVAEIIAIKTILELKKKVIFILPFVSIVREKMYYFQDLLETSGGIRVDGFMGSYNPPGGFGSIQFAICTIEKANSLINRLLEEGTLSDIGAVLIDEMHLLGDSSRGYLLELLLTKLRYISKKDNLSIQIIGMSATLPNLDQIANWLDAELYTTDFRPVPLNEQAQVCNEIYDKDLILKRKLNILSDLKTDSDNILQLCLETIKESCSVLIFCPTKNWCENLSLQIATGFFKIGSLTGEWSKLLRSQLDTNLIIELLEQLKYCPVGLDGVLQKTVSFGVAFHHAGLTMDERDIIEGAFRIGALRVLVATSTLSSGVNLPARRVIIRTPIFHGKPLDSLIYRQMIGRAGRMGKDSIGESFLICQKNDFKIAKDLMSAELTPIKSCLETAGKLKRAILEVVASGVASTPQDIQLFTESTLMAIENGDIQELSNPIEEAIAYLQVNEFIRLQNQNDGTEKYIPSSLGKACLSSSIAPDEGLSLFTELEKARQCLVLETELHLIYLVTPYSACYSWQNLDWMLYLNLWEKLPLNMKKVGKLVGIGEAYVINATRKKIQTNTASAYHKFLVHKRFFVALALQDLVNEKPLSWVCEKFNCNRGMLQSLQQSASSFAGMVTAFSKQLGWTSMELLLSQFQDRMQFGVNRDLLDLMHLPVLNGKMARSLYNAGIESLVELANSEISTIENILHRIVPFESEKNREGESELEKNQRNKFRNVWITGREGLTVLEAAQIFVVEARKHLKIGMGLVDAKWKDEVGGHEYINDAELNKSEENKIIVNFENVDKKIENNEVLQKQSDASNISIVIPVVTINKSNNNSDLKMSQNNEDVNLETRFSDDSSILSNNLNISDSSSISNTDSTKIEDLEEDNLFQDTSNLSEKLEKITINPQKEITTIKNLDKIYDNINDGKKEVNNILKDISISDFSDTLSEMNQFSLNKTIITPKISVNDVSQLIKPCSVEINISGSSIKSNMSISFDKMQSDQSLFEESFTLQLEGVKKENTSCSQPNSFLQNSDDDDYQSSDDIFGKSIEEEHVSFSAKKRKYDSFGESQMDKTCKIQKLNKKELVTDLNKTYFLNKPEDQHNTDFSKIEIVNVCQEVTLLDAFSNDIKEQEYFSFSIACCKFVESKTQIGINILKPQGPHLHNYPEEQKKSFTYAERKVEGFSFFWKSNVIYYLSVENVKLHKKILKLLKTIFKNTNIRVTIFDSKEQIKVLKNCFGIDFYCKIIDPKVADWLLNPEQKENNLKAMVLKYCPEGIELSQLSGGCKGVGSVGLDIYSNTEPKIRSSSEAILSWHLTINLKNKLIEQIPNYLKAYDTENDVIVILARIELNGISINKTALKTLLETLKSQLCLIEKKAYALAGRHFNFASSVDVAKVTGMFRGRKVSTRKQLLEKNQHPISDLVLQWRKLHSIVTKTIHPLMQASSDERIHGCYITHTATGRISMHEPNLQNINKDFEVSNSATKEILSISCREVFEAPEDYSLVSADYCQLELRILTHFSQDKLLCKIMSEVGDVFKIIAARWNNIKEEEVTDNIRQNAKHLCYGIIYGMGTKTLADQLNIQEMEALEFMDTFKNTYPGIKTFILQTIENCRKYGYVETINGRKRFLPHIMDTEQTKKGQAERQAVNTIVQGSAADIVKGAMIKVEKELEEVFHKTKSKPKIVLHLHDELIYEVPNKYLRKVARIIKKNMENSVELSVPFPVKLKTGKSWGNMLELIL